MRLRKRITIIPLLFAGLLFASGCGSSSSTTTTDTTNRIYVLGADAGSASGMSDGVYRFTLTGVDAGVDWYTDRPDRVTGEETTGDYLTQSWSGVYGDVSPNVFIQYHDGQTVHGIAGQIDNVAYDDAAKSLSFDLTVSKASADLTGGVGDFRAPVVTILDNLTPPAEGSAFALYGATAMVEEDGAGGYRLVMTAVDPEVFWINNAPARAAEFETSSDFASGWSYRFGDTPPNASLTGDFGDGTYEIRLLTLSNPTYDSATATLTFTATPIDDPGAPPLATTFTEAVLYVDSADNTSPSTRFASGVQWRGFSWAAIPSELTVTPQQGATGIKGALFDSDTSAIHFQAIWGKKGSCGREDLKTMASYGANIIRLYDYNYARYVQPRANGELLDIKTAGDGHIAFLDEAAARGMKVIIPIPASNFDDGEYAWSVIDTTVAQIINSVKKNGRIHPAVHSFSVGNELDMPRQDYLISRAVEVVQKIHALAPDHYITIPISNANEARYYGIFKNGGSGVPAIPASIYNSRFYNSVQTFKRSDDLERDILAAYDAGGWGVPLVITELGTSKVDVGQSVDQQVAAVERQASIVRTYMDAHPTSLVKGFSLFQWQNAFYKLNGANQTTFADAWYGVHSYAGSLCTSSTGKFELWNYAASSNQYILFHQDVSYSVDKLVPLTNSAGESLIDKIKPYLQ